MNGLEAPTVLEQAGGQPVEQFGMRGRFGLGAEIVRRGHKPMTEVMLPEAIHNYAGGDVARSVLNVGEPVGQGLPAVGASGAFSGLDLPVHRVLAVAHQEREECLGGNLSLTVGVAA